MSTPSIYGEYAQYLPNILQEITDPIIAANIASKKETGFKLYEHFISRIKESDSMREKCRRKNLPETSQSACFYSSSFQSSFSPCFRLPTQCSPSVSLRCVSSV